MSRIVLLTPDPADDSFHGRWREPQARLEAALGDQGLAVESLPWVEATVGCLANPSLVLPMLAWGYHRDHARWRALTEAWGEAGLPVANPAEVLNWNSDKRYLVRLLAAGAPVVPTVFVKRLTLAALRGAADAFGTDRLVAKPPVSASAYRTVRWSPDGTWGDGLDGAPDGAAMIQPYRPAVETEGEASLIYIDGTFSHALIKVARAGDFRVQPDWGGLVSSWVPDAAAREAADRVLTAIAEPLLYARIDLVRSPDGAWELMEAELIEPDLYLDTDPLGGAGFGRAVARRVSGT